MITGSKQSAGARANKSPDRRTDCTDACWYRGPSCLGQAEQRFKISSTGRVPGILATVDYITRKDATVDMAITIAGKATAGSRKKQQE